MSRTLTSSLFLVLLPAVGCTNFDLAGADEASSVSDTGRFAGEDDLFQAPVRLDVQPLSTPQVQGRALLPQTFWLEAPGVWTDQGLTMQPTVRVTGTVTGFAANPYGSMAGPTVPGQDNVPVVAQIELYQPDSIAAAQTISAEDGTFELYVPAGDGYRLVVRPIEPTALPLLVYDDLSLSEDVDLSTPSGGVPDALAAALYLDYGDPVVGRILDASGAPVLCGVRLIDPESGEPGPTAETDENGYYFLRAEPGTYYLQVSGDGVVPTTGKEISFEADVGGFQLDFNLGDLDPVFVSGRVRSATGEVVDDARVRMTSRSLDAAEGVLVVEDETNSSGEFTIRALPGEWTVEVIPPNETLSDASSLEFDQTIATSNQGLGTIELPAKVPVQRRVVGVEGQSAGSVVLTFYQQGFNGGTYNVITDGDGSFSLDLPDVPMTVYMNPLTSPGAAITRRELLQPSTDTSTVWSLSDGIAISGAVNIAGLPEAEAGSYLIAAYDEDGLLLGNILTLKEDEQARFSFRVDLEGTTR